MNAQLRSTALILVLAAGLAGLVGPARCDEPSLTVEQAQEEALGRSPQLRIAQAGAQERRWGRVEAAAAFWPRVELQADHFGNVQFQTLAFNGGVFPEAYPYSNLGFNGMWTVFEGLAGWSRLQAARLRAQAAGLDEGWAAFALRQDVRLKYFQALAAQRLATLSDENVRTLEDHLRIVQDLLDNGQATRFDVLRVEVQLSEARTERLSAQDRVLLSRRKLTQVMGLDEGDERPLVGDLPEPSAESVSAGTPLDELPTVRARALDAAAALDSQRAAQAAWAPRVSLVGGYQWYNNMQMDVGDLADYRTAYQLGVQADWDLFSGGAAVAKAQQARQQAEQALERRRQARLQARWDRDLWTRRLAYSVQLYQAKLQDVDKSKESVRLATLGEQAGTRTSTEVLDAELDAFRASAGAVQARMDAAEARINLELALGQGESR